jgi:hypothetical protein
VSDVIIVRSDTSIENVMLEDAGEKKEESIS